GAIIPQPVVPLAHVLMGALGECALYVARAEDPDTAREECIAILDRILRSITPGAYGCRRTGCRYRSSASREMLAIAMCLTLSASSGAHVARERGKEVG